MIIKTNHTKHSFILLVVSVIVLISSFFSFTAAWFTNTKMFKMGGLVPTIDAKIYSSGFEESVEDANTVTLTLKKSVSTSPTITFKSISTVDTYFRVKFAFKWANNDNDISGNTILSCLTFTLSDKFYSYNGNADTDDEKITDNSQWLYFKRNSNAVITDSTPFRIIENIQKAENATISNDIKIIVTYQIVQANSAGLASFGNDLPTDWPVATS